MKMFFTRIAKLIDVKSIVTLLFSVCISIGFLTGKVDVQDYLKVCMIALTFFFSFQSAKNSNSDEKGKE